MSRYDAPCHICGAMPTRFYIRGRRCREHAPPSPPVPDPERTLEGMRQAAGIRTRTKPTKGDRETIR